MPAFVVRRTSGACSSAHAHSSSGRRSHAATSAGRRDGASVVVAIAPGLVLLMWQALAETGDSRFGHDGACEVLCFRCQRRLGLLKGALPWLAGAGTAGEQAYGAGNCEEDVCTRVAGHVRAKSGCFHLEGLPHGARCAPAAK